MSSASLTTGQSEQIYKRMFEQADADGNGYVDQEEAQRNFFFRNCFLLMDRDGDGKVFEEEMLAFVRQQEVLARCRTVLNITDQGRNLFDILDLNRDNRLSPRELAAAAVERLPLWDEDGDGRLSRSEIPRLFRLMLGRPGMTGLPVFRGAVGAPGQPAPGRATAGPLWFRKMDRNGDGEVSRQEFLGTDEQFRQLDRNADGILEPHEVE